MKYVVYNPSSGDAWEMKFDTLEQMKKWLEHNSNFEIIEELTNYLPTRHVRMNVEFAGWGS